MLHQACTDLHPGDRQPKQQITLLALGTSLNSQSIVSDSPFFHFLNHELVNNSLLYPCTLDGM